MNINPLKISVYFIITLLILLGLLFLSNANDSKKEGFQVFSYTLKYPTAQSFFSEENNSKETKKSIDSIVNNIESIVVDVGDVVVDIDTIPKDSKENFKPIIPDFSKIDTSKVRRISYPSNKQEFISNLKSQLTSENCRIIHYGDSQLEGDRISGYLRNRLQQLYGGSGLGFIPVVQTYQQISVDITPSENWERFASFDPIKKKFDHKKYGAFTSLARFTPDYATDKESLDSLSVSTATIKIKPSSKSYRLLKAYSYVTLHYGNLLTSVGVDVYSDGALIKKDSLIKDGKYHQLKLKFGTTPNDLNIVFKGKISPDVYGITLDGTSGIQLDNVAMRGSSGTIFASANSENFSAMYKTLDPKVLIFQYGGNTVPYLKDSLSVTNYARYLKNHINWVKRKTNNASVIFIGPSDMTTMENGEMKTYDLLPYLNIVLESTCHENNIAYWSMFDAMGGENSMQHWVDQKLAGSDYTHFTHSGTKVISELFFMALYMDLKSN
ncbi:SGNH/GDSL hydrolase family protein [Aurantibacter aestuarii]|uniref:Lipase n=1 Tax=Aurantibacter aestuarii TaxID=1266046 RepID=A0A2T1N973_9FLAO|nr:lipase [Aurantibacter aestuarii]PSG88409.1 lipase [Aurantibacter aestuarii]